MLIVTGRVKRQKFGGRATRKNYRISCTSCNHLTTKNQAKKSGLKCLYCNAPLKGVIEVKI